MLEVWENVIGYLGPLRFRPQRHARVVLRTWIFKTAHFEHIWRSLRGGAGKFWIFDEKIKIFDTKLRESTGNRSQMFSGGVGDVCDALSRVCALSGGEKPQKFTKNQESESRFLTVP